MQDTDKGATAQPIIVTVNGRTYELQPTTALDRDLAAIARRRLGITTGLGARGSDRLDFHDCHVAGIRAALAEAFEAGRLAGAS
jgi:hypothetical protein